MKCVICKVGETKKGYTNVTLEKQEMVLVIKHVPCEVCANCGEEYVDENVSSSILDTAQKTFQEGVQLEVRNFKAA